jgi:thiaminase (transcriptional activator TenA)
MLLRMAAALSLLVPVASGGEFTQSLWQEIGPIYARTLADGTLPRDRFAFYLEQDSAYLRRFAEVLRLLARKAPRGAWRRTLERHSGEAIEAERALHRSILESFGSAQGQAAMAPTNYAYTNHLLAAASQGSFAEGLAAMLPCYWIYQEVGRELVKRGSKDAAYQKWIDNYAGEEYAKSVAEVLAMMDDEAARLSARQRDRCRELFRISARYEYLFWDMAWRKEQWKP